MGRFYADPVSCSYIPTSVGYEIFVFEFYLKVVDRMLQDIYVEEGKVSNHHEMFAQRYLLSQRNILEAQRSMLRESIGILCRLTQGAGLMESIRALPLDRLRGIVRYLKEVEQFL